MVVKTVYIILLLFVLLVVVVPIVLGVLGISVIPDGGWGGSGSGSTSTQGLSGVLLRSSDGGGHWTAAEWNRDNRPALPAGISDIAFHPTNTDVVFAGTIGSGLWKSENTGAVWRKINDANHILQSAADVYKIAISSTKPDVMYLATVQSNRGRVLRTDDGGDSWHEIYSVTQDGWAVFDIYTPPGLPDNVMIATGEGRLLASGDGGKQWRLVRSVGAPIAKLAVNPTFSGERYLISALGTMAKSFDSGETWSELGNPADTQSDNGDGSSVGVIRHPYSNWRFTFSAPALSFSFAIDPQNPALLYFIRDDALFSSFNGGFGWRKLTTLITSAGTALGGVAVSPSRGGTIFVAAGPDLYQTADGGASWSVASVAPGASLKKIFIHPRRPDIMFITAGR